MRRALGIVATAFALGCAIIVLLSFFIRSPILDGVGERLAEHAVILAAFALLAGTLNVILFHVRELRRRAPGWPYSLVLITAVVVLLVLGGPGTDGPNAPAIAFAFEYLLVPLQAAAFSLLAFFILAVAYRAVRVKSWEMLLLLGSALVVLVAGTPLVGAVAFLPALRDWLVSVPVAAAARGMLLGIAVGIIATGVRLLADGRRSFG